MKLEKNEGNIQNKNKMLKNILLYIFKIIKTKHWYKNNIWKCQTYDTVIRKILFIYRIQIDIDDKKQKIM